MTCGPDGIGDEAAGLRAGRESPTDPYALEITLLTFARTPA